MKRIICPTDFSATAQNAVVYAAKLAHAVGAELTLFNVQSLFELTPEEMLHGKALAIQAVHEQLEDQCREVRRVFKISCYADIQPSTRSMTKVISTRASDFDLIVMGTNGVDDVYQFFAGTNTYHVIRQVSVPVLLVPDGVGYTEISRVVYAFDYLKQRKLPLDQLLPLVEQLNSELSVVQVLEEAYSLEVEKDLKELQLYCRKQLQDKVKFGFDTIHSNELAGSINSYVLRTDADMLALCTLHHNFIEKLFHKSVIKVISGIASYPVFIFHH